MADANKAKKLPQYVASIVATLGGFSLGTVIGWSSPAIPVIQDNGKGITELSLSWIASLMTLGGLSSMFVMALLLDRIGRKITMIVIVPVFLAGWVTLAFGEDEIAYMIGRFITGLGGASFCVAAPVYIGEIAQKDVRGTLGVFFQLLLVIGILYAYAVGSYRDLLVLSLGCCVPVVVFVILILFMPESPLFLIGKGKNEAATKSLQWLRGKNYDTAAEMKEMQTLVEESNQRKGSLKDIFKHKASVKALLTALLLMFCQQLSGINIVMFYAVSIFKDAGSDMDPYLAGVILGIIQVFATGLAAVCVDRVGRRILLILSHFGMGLCLLILGVYFLIKSNDEDLSKQIGSLPLLSCCLYLVFFSLGSGPLPWAMVGELFPNEIKGIASSISGGVNWLLAFVVSASFPTLIRLFKSAITFWIYAGFCFAGTILIFIFVIETKNKTLDEIQKELGGET